MNDRSSDIPFVCKSMTGYIYNGKRYDNFSDQPEFPYVTRLWIARWAATFNRLDASQRAFIDGFDKDEKMAFDIGVAINRRNKIIQGSIWGRFIPRYQTK